MLEKNTARTLSRAAARVAADRGAGRALAKSLSDRRFMTRKETPRNVYSRKGRAAAKIYTGDLDHD